MFSIFLVKNLRLLPLLALPLLTWLIPEAPKVATGTFSPEKVNLALRRTADGLLRASGDSTSRIPAIKQSGENTWSVRLTQPFVYEMLPNMLQSSLDLYGITRTYQVAIRRCDDSIINLGYHKLDVKEDAQVACGGRAMPDGCHFIEVTFLDGSSPATPFPVGKSAALVLLLGGMAGIWYFRRKKQVPATPSGAVETDWLEFGNSRLDVAGQVLLCGGVRHTLTFRETKLLRLFASSPNRLLERDFVLREVWADEGVLVGRSVDVFVSRLRKKMAADTSVGIVAVHGVGYRLETGKTA